MTDQIRKIEEYVYLKYIDPGNHGAMDEEVALRQLEEHYRRPAHAADPECFYVGVLLFEHSYAITDPVRRAAWLQGARWWLERSRQLTGEAWDPVDDRLSDIEGTLADEGVALAPLGPQPPEIPGLVAVPVLPAEIEHHGTMVLVPGGPFLFGPQPTERVLPAFYIDKYPVTNRQFDAFCRATQYRKPKYAGDARFNSPDQPVVGVSVADALRYCRWAQKDLPTEEQWERAARDTDGRIRPWGDEPISPAHACYGRDPETGGTAPVTDSERGRSVCGAADLLGNAWEWTATTIAEGEGLAIVKGGCYSDPGAILRADLRLEAGAKDKFENIGFRCVKPA